jgi:hypothetical protein
MSNSKAKGILTLFGVLTAAVLAALVVFSSGPRQIIADDEATRCAQNIIEQLDGSKQTLLKGGIRVATQDCGITLYVSMSANMQGYLGGLGQNTKFREILGDIGKIPAQGLEINAIGTPREGGFSEGHPALRDLQVQKNYNRKDNDFTPAITNIAAQPNRLHLILTDGVEWHTNLLDYYQDVFHSANVFLKKGGNIAFLVFRGDFHGPYSSAILTAQNGPQGNRLDSLVDYDVKDRPFLIWAFLPPGVSLENLDKDYLKIVKADNAPFELDLRDGDVIPTVATNELPAPGERRPKALLRDAQMVYSSPELQPFVKASVSSAAVGNGYFPLEFELACSQKLLDRIKDQQTDVAAWLSGSIHAELTCWELKRQRGGSYTNMPIPAKDLNILGGKWEIEKSLQENMAGASEEQKRPRLIYKVRKPPGDSEGTRFFAWLVTLRPTPHACDDLIPPEFSTSDDSKPEQANRILNLGSMMSSIASQTQVLGRVFVVTEWR